MALRLALDQNFPIDLLRALADWLPEGVELTHLNALDRRLGAPSDRQLFIALHQMGFDGLVTNNYKMFNLADEVAAILATKAVVIAMEAMGHDPIRAADALLLGLPGLASRLRPNTSNVVLLNYARRQPVEGWAYMKRIADRERLEAVDLWTSVRVSPEELASPVLSAR